MFSFDGECVYEDLQCLRNKTNMPEEKQIRISSNLFLPCKPVTLFTDKSRQEPTRAVKCRQEAFLHILRLKYYLIDHIYALYIQISHIVSFAAPKNNEFTTLQIALLTDKKFCEAVLAVYVGCHKDFIVIPKTA